MSFRNMKEEEDDDTPRFTFGTPPTERTVNMTPAVPPMNLATIHPPIPPPIPPPIHTPDATDGNNNNGNNDNGNNTNFTFKCIENHQIWFFQILIPITGDIKNQTDFITLL